MPNSRPAVVAIINSNDDLVAILEENLKAGGYNVVSAHIAQIKTGKQDFPKFLRLHQPDVVIYDVAIPYQENWTFLMMLRHLPECHSIPFVITTVNKRALDEELGKKTDCVEIRGGHADDLQPVIDAVDAALKRKHRR